jgi:AcrR family transcriptional regulator
MARIDLVRRAEIGRERRERTRAMILDAGAMLLAERAPDALTVEAVVEAAGVAKGTFYYHFQSIGELTAAVGQMLSADFDEFLAPARQEFSDPVARFAFAFTEFLYKGIADPAWARLVVQSAKHPAIFGQGVSEHLKADLTEAISLGRLTVTDVDLAVDVVMGIWLQVMRGLLDRGATSDLPARVVETMLRALGAKRSDGTQVT